MNLLLLLVSCCQRVWTAVGFEGQELGHQFCKSLLECCLSRVLNLSLNSWLMGLRSSFLVGMISNNASCVCIWGSQWMASSLMTKGQFNILLKCSAHLLRKSSLSVIRVVPSVLRRVMYLMLWVRRFLSNHYRNSSCHFYQQNLEFHQLSCLAMNPACDAVFVGWSCIWDLVPASLLQRTGHPEGLCGHFVSYLIADWSWSSSHQTSLYASLRRGCVVNCLTECWPSCLNILIF